MNSSLWHWGVVGCTATASRPLCVPIRCAGWKRCRALSQHTSPVCRPQSNTSGMFASPPYCTPGASQHVASSHSEVGQLSVAASAFRLPAEQLYAEQFSVAVGYGGLHCRSSICCVFALDALARRRVDALCGKEWRRCIALAQNMAVLWTASAPAKATHTACVHLPTKLYRTPGASQHAASSHPEDGQLRVLALAFGMPAEQV